MCLIIFRELFLQSHTYKHSKLYKCCVAQLLSIRMLYLTSTICTLSHHSQFGPGFDLLCLTRTWVRLGALLMTHLTEGELQQAERDRAAALSLRLQRSPNRFSFTESKMSTKDSMHAEPGVLWHSASERCRSTRRWGRMKIKWLLMFLQNPQLRQEYGVWGLCVKGDRQGIVLQIDYCKRTYCNTKVSVDFLWSLSAIQAVICSGHLGFEGSFRRRFLLLQAASMVQTTDENPGC